MRTWVALPDARPKGTNVNLLVAWVAYRASENEKIGGKAEQEASHLFVQDLFSLSHGHLATDLLRSATGGKKRASRWITVSTPTKGAHGHLYALGPAALAHADRWLEVGRELFGPAGVMDPYMFRPVLLKPPKGLGANGCLCLGFVEKYGPVSITEVIEALGGFMSAPTIRAKVKRCQSSGFILEKHGQFVTPRNLRQRIRQDEYEFGAVTRRREISEEIRLKQYSSQVERLGGPTMDHVLRTLRNSPCFYCDAVPRLAGAQVEHFPPVHWGGSDEFSLLLPICLVCNSRHGGIIRRTPALPPPEVLKTAAVLPMPPEKAATWITGLMMAQAQQYALALDEGRVDDARDAALRFFPMWASLKTGAQVVDGRTGETAEVTVGHDLDVIAEMGEAIGGVPEALTGKSRKARAAKKQAER